MLWTLHFRSSVETNSLACRHFRFLSAQKTMKERDEASFNSHTAAKIFPARLVLLPSTTLIGFYRTIINFSVRWMQRECPVTFNNRYRDLPRKLLTFREIKFILEHYFSVTQQKNQQVTSRGRPQMWRFLSKCKPSGHTIGTSRYLEHW